MENNFQAQRSLQNSMLSHGAGLFMRFEDRCLMYNSITRKVDVHVPRTTILNPNFWRYGEQHPISNCFFYEYMNTSLKIHYHNPAFHVIQRPDFLSERRSNYGQIVVQLSKITYVVITRGQLKVSFQDAIYHWAIP